MKRKADLRIVIAYENLPDAFRAKELVDSLADQLAPDIGIDTGVWKFDCLSHPGLLKAAFEETSEADMIILTSGAAKLPAHVEDWLEICLC